VIRSMLKAGLVLALVIWQQQVAAAESVGRVVAVSGKADVIRSSDNSRHELAFKDPIFLNDRIITAASSQVKLLLNDDSILKVSPTSELRVSEQVVGPGEESRTTVNLLKGKLRSIIGKQLGGNSRFEVHTDVAVAGVRGTDFEVLAAGETLVRCFTGVVQVGNIDPKILQFVLLNANMFTRVLKGQAPTPPAFIAPGERLRSKLSKGEGDESGEEDSGEGDEGDSGEGDGLIEDELDQLDGEEDDRVTGDDTLPSPPDTTMTEKTLLLGDVLENEIYGDPSKGQVEIVVEPAATGVAVPIDITIPAP
jgi:hypothetical protein